MGILNICNNADVLSAMRIIRIIILIIRISVPIILMLSVMISYVGAVKDNDSDALNKVSRGVVPRVVAALLVFFVPTFVNLIADIVDVNKNSYISCIKIATKENINEARYNEALKKVHAARSSLSKGDYQAAVSAVNKIKEHNLKYGLEIELAELQEYINMIDTINSLKISFDRGIYKQLEKDIYEITDQNAKEKIQKLYNEIRVEDTLDIQTGLFLKGPDKMKYNLIIPPNPTKNMALIIFLHGDEGFNTRGVTACVNENELYDKEEFFYMAPTPKGYSSWDKRSVIEDLKEVIDSVINEYSIDKDRIIITGYDDGATGTWSSVNSYPSFYSASVPVSGAIASFNANNFKNTAVWAFSGDSGSKEKNNSTAIQNIVNQINEANGYAKYTQLKDRNHADMEKTFCNKEVIDWVLDQKRG